jgi:hypothetical protein
VKRYRVLIHFLLAISFFIPLNMAYLYADSYADIDLLPRKHLASEDEDSLLVFFQKNPRILVSPGPSIQPYVAWILGECFFLSDFFLPKDSKTAILRC